MHVLAFIEGKTGLCGSHSVPCGSGYAQRALPASMFACGFPADVCSLPAHSAGRGEQAVIFFRHTSSAASLWMFFFCFFQWRRPIRRRLLHHAPKGRNWQLNRFHHFPDCAGTATACLAGGMSLNSIRLSSTGFICQIRLKENRCHAPPALPAATFSVETAANETFRLPGIARHVWQLATRVQIRAQSNQV